MEEIENRILHYAENHDLKPWTLVKRVSEDTGENFDDVKEVMRRMVMDWELQIRAGGNIDIDRHE